MTDMEMTKFMILISDAIKNIDGGCTSCIKYFLARCYKLQNYDLELVLSKIDDEYSDIKSKDIIEIISYYEN